MTPVNDNPGGVFTMNKTGPRGGCTFALIRIIAVFIFVGAVLIAGNTLIPAHGADLDYMQRTFGIIDLKHCSGSGQGPIDCPRDYYAMAPTQFGEFSPGYLKRRAEREEKRKMRPVPLPKPRPETQCWDFDKHDTPNGFANALENPVPCKDLVK
jgi:hypothetical protein